MRSLLYIMILVVIAGCSYSNGQPKAFAEAQRLMRTDPSAALSKLNGINVSEFQDSATMAQWALLYSEAMVANNLSAPTDTIVNIAIDYYGSHNLNAELNKAFRLKALILSSGTTTPLVTALYMQKEKEFFLYQERAKRELYTFIGVAMLLIAVGVIIWLRQKVKIQSLRNEFLMAEAARFKNQIESSRCYVGRLETKLRMLLVKRFNFIDSLCQTYYESQVTKTERKAIINKVKNEIESMRTDSFVEIEQAVNDCRDNLLSKVKDNYSEIKDADYRLLVYMAGGFSTRSISLLLDESVEVVYKRKSRLKSRLNAVVGPVCPEIMTVF